MNLIKEKYVKFLKDLKIFDKLRLIDLFIVCSRKTLMKLIYTVFAIFHLKHLQLQFIYVHVLLLTLCCYSQYVVTNVAP